MTPQATLFLIVGLPGAGKTTRARELEKAHRALRFSPGEWMIPLFGESDADGKRDLLEGLLINAGLCALAVGTNVVLDFGLWGRDERSALRSLGASVGAGVEVVYLPVDEATQLQRVQERFLVSPGHTFPIADSDQHRQVPRPTWLRPQRPSPTTNPCYLGRHNGVCAPLREFIGALPGA